MDPLTLWDPIQINHMPKVLYEHYSRDRQHAITPSPTHNYGTPSHMEIHC